MDLWKTILICKNSLNVCEYVHVNILLNGSCFWLVCLKLVTTFLVQAQVQQLVCEGYSDIS